MDDGCLFCKIVNGEIHATELFRTDDVVAFRDINPKAPVHVLVVSIDHVPSISELDNDELGGKLLRNAAEVARREGISESGYRVVTNTGPHAGQSVNHLHLHVLGGRHMDWPPG